MSQYVYIIKNFIYLFLAKGVDLVIPLVLLPMLVNRLGFEKYGVITMSISLALYLGAIIQYGFALSGTREIARAEHNKELLNQKFSQYFITSHCLALLVFILSSITLFFINIELTIKIIYFTAILYSCFYSINPIWLFQGLEKFRVLATISSLCKLAYVFSIYFFITNPEDYRYVNLLNFLSVLAIYILSCCYIFLYLKLSINKIKFNDVFLLLKKDVNVFLNQIVPNFYNNFSVFYLGLISGSSVAGLASSAMTLAEGAITIFRILLNVVYPFIVKNQSHFRIFSKILTALIAIGFTFFILILPYVIDLMFKTSEDIILNYTYILSISIAFACIYLLYGLIYNLVTDNEKRITKMVVKVSLFSSLLMLLLTPYYNAYAVLFIIVLTRFLFAFFSVKFYLKDKVNFL